MGESITLPPLSSLLATARQSSRLTSKMPLNLDHVPSIDFPPILPEPLGSYKLPSAPKRAASAPIKKKTVPVSKPKATSLKTTKEKKLAPSKANPKLAAKKTSARSVKLKSVKSPVKKVAAKKGKK
ncbi:Hypothetical predicted protein [Olea europaea subsp. europaea]|uniref:Uncharacterized protein n=1 Tax=Olea europaea subsp. europaea TaxID=158383 RepID=A0A8S0RDC5_OLEEU|nr:Hypothetical predicted protein [Olea europaea subsp. europaea]